MTKRQRRTRARVRRHTEQLFAQTTVVVAEKKRPFWTYLFGARSTW